MLPILKEETVRGQIQADDGQCLGSYSMLKRTYPNGNVEYFNVFISEREGGIKT